MYTKSCTTDDANNLIRLYITGAVEVKWVSAKGPHSCLFDIQWLREHDYTSKEIMQERIEEAKPLLHVSNFLLQQLT